MTDTVPTPVPGDPATKGRPDGVSDPPRDDDATGVHGRTEGGESGGGAYPNPHTGKTPTDSGAMGHGGQTDIAYHGGGQSGENGGSAPNGVTGSDTGTRTTKAADPAADRKPHGIAAEGRTIEVVETSGVAEAEAVGKVGTNRPHDDEQRRPGSG